MPSRSDCRFSWPAARSRKVPRTPPQPQRSKCCSCAQRRSSVPTTASSTAALSRSTIARSDGHATDSCASAFESSAVPEMESASSRSGGSRGGAVSSSSQPQRRRHRSARSRPTSVQTAAALRRRQPRSESDSSDSSDDGSSAMSASSSCQHHERSSVASRGHSASRWQSEPPPVSWRAPRKLSEPMDGSHRSKRLASSSEPAARSCASTLSLTSTGNGSCGSAVGSSSTEAFPAQNAPPAFSAAMRDDCGCSPRWCRSSVSSARRRRVGASSGMVTTLNACGKPAGPGDLAGCSQLDVFAP